MPELPDIELYLSALSSRLLGQPLERVRIVSPLLLRTVDPKVDDAVGSRVVRLFRIGKRIVWEFEGERFFVFHLMIAGRFRWRPRGAAVPRRVGLAAFDFPQGTLLLTEAATRKRASLHVVRGADAVREHDRGGLDVIAAGDEQFAQRLIEENHTIKRALTDPRLFDGIGNAYSDEILHRARLSPFKLTRQLESREIEELRIAARETLLEWIERLQREAGQDFPEKVTAFREGMSVHGRFGKPCPRCGTPVQRIVHGEHETNYCPQCQTEGRLLADRSLSRLLKDDWPRSLDELEERRERLRKT